MILLEKKIVLSDACNKFSAKFAPRFIKCKVVRKIGTNSYQLENEQALGIWSARDIKPRKRSKVIGKCCLNIVYYDVMIKIRLK